MCRYRSVGRNGTILASRVREAQNADGGFGPRIGLPSEPEPTALATIALDDERGRAWLGEHQTGDGSVSLDAGVVVNDSATAFAAIAARPGDGRERALDHLEAALAPDARSTADVPFDAAFHGWAWTESTFGWVDPTARRGAGARGCSGPARRPSRTASACCATRETVGGGWNYGNRVVLGEDLEPYAQTTAAALVALQRADPALEQRGLLGAPPVVARGTRRRADGGAGHGCAPPPRGRRRRRVRARGVRHVRPLGVHGRRGRARVGGDRDRPGALRAWRCADGRDGPADRSWCDPPSPRASREPRAVVGGRILRHPQERPWDEAAFAPPGIGARRRAPRDELRRRPGRRRRRGAPRDRCRRPRARVLLKPNLVEFDEDTAINTDPRLVAAAVVAAPPDGAPRRRGGRGPGHRRDTQFVVASSGLLEALDARGRTVRRPEHR